MINREIYNTIKPWLGANKILILKGARQVGKTFLLKKIKTELESSGKKVVYLLADSIENKDIFNSSATLEVYLKQYFNFPQDFVYLMIDEFQVIKEAGLFLKNIFDKYPNQLQLIVSGSSSLEINKNSEYLTGRAIHFEIARINFKEFFEYYEGIVTRRFSLKEFQDLKIFYQTFRTKLELGLSEYFSYGGYPEVIITSEADKKEIIFKSIINSYINKDIINQLNIENITGFNNLIKILSSQIGQLVNNHELSNTANLAINTLKKYLEILVGTYVIDLVSPYSKNIRSEISKMPKVYLLDLGIRNFLLRTYTVNLDGEGEVIENFVYNTLLTQYSKEYLHFYRTLGGAEIDFVVEDKNNKLIIMEVKYRNKVKLPVVMKNFALREKNVHKKVIITKDDFKYADQTYFIPAVVLPFVKFE